MAERDDAAFLQAILDEEAARHPHGEVYTVTLPRDDYQLRRSLVVPRNARIDGSGSSLSPHPDWELWYTDHAPLIRVRRDAGNNITDFRIEGSP
jgi:hypothetical protein